MDIVNFKCDFLNIFDNFFSKFEHEDILNYCIKVKYNSSEFDGKNLPSTGKTCNIFPETDLYKLFSDKIQNNWKNLKSNKIYAMYINRFKANENPYFHKDGNSGITVLYYPSNKWNIQDGGETQFFLENQIIGIPPIPNRIIIFESNILHRATTFRNKDRFTVAIKYDNININYE